MKVALGITGCIAAYKAIEVMRGLQRAGHSVQVVLTRSGAKFVRALTFEALSGQSVILDMFRRDLNRDIEHIQLAQEVAMLAVVPATANILGKFANGIADDFLSTLYLSCPAPVLLAPAMNVEMWNHPAVQANVETLSRRGNLFVNPEAGELACGMQGEGRLADVDVIVSRILEHLHTGTSLKGTRVLVTAGPTVEDLDPVRFISNRSSGKMGYAVAAAAGRRGAEVTLVSGPTALPIPRGVRHIPVRSAEDMKQAVLKLYPESDIVIKAAAVADYRPSAVAAHKIKKGDANLSLELVRTDDILQMLGRQKTHQVLVGFAAETENLLKNASAKMEKKNLDMLVANDVSAGVFGSDAATVHILRGRETLSLENRSKLSIADTILDMAHSIYLSRKNVPARI